MKVINISEGHKLWQQIQGLFPTVMKWRNNPKDKGNYYFFSVVDSDSNILSAVAIDIGPMVYGPFKRDKIAFIEGIVHPFISRRVINRILKQAIRFCKAKKCHHIRGQIDYKGKITLQTMQKLGFAIVPIDNRKDTIKTNQYLVVKPLL
ncbi:MAG: hypothetical protein QME51_03555 [Planctomycetota bacterium]|nr:hypothetical protein [Planctomycetota bacterium]MDI6787426.1 hypothetical protein [Planctomycetota bacterium]